MNRYIDADKLIAEIERLGRNWDGVQELQPASLFQIDLYELLFIIDSLQQEQTEVDLEKEVDEWRDKNFDKSQDFKLSGENATRKSQIELARHFYELGINARKED